MKGFFCDKNGEFSSKRLCGIVGIAVIIVCFVHDDYIGKEMPAITEFLMGSFVVLLGADTAKDTITNIANKSNGNNEGNTEEGDAEH